MKNTLATIVMMVAALGLTGTGCSKNKGGKSSSATSVKAYTGPVDYARLNGALKKASTAWGKSGPGMFAPWDNAYNMLLKEVGKETAQKGDTYFWAYAKGDKCWYLQADKKDGKFKNAKSTNTAKNLKASYTECMSHLKK